MNTRGITKFCGCSYWPNQITISVKYGSHVLYKPWYWSHKTHLCLICYMSLWKLISFSLWHMYVSQFPPRLSQAQWAEKQSQARWVKWLHKLCNVWYLPTSASSFCFMYRKKQFALTLKYLFILFCTAVFHIDGLEQDCNISIVNAPEIL